MAGVNNSSLPIPWHFHDSQNLKNSFSFSISRVKALITIPTVSGLIIFVAAANPTLIGMHVAVV
ncbi:hypothetical protein P826_02623 [Enterobacter hormaechei]|nr:hypothetical protein P826_02623 [Enterobacter hormaechei]